MLLASDKEDHLYIGTLIGTICIFIAYYNDWSYFWVYGFLGALLGGVLKEAWDLFQNFRAIAKRLPKPHSVEIYDIVATAVGGLIFPSFIYFIYQRTRR